MRVTSVKIGYTMQARQYEPIHMELEIELDKNDKVDEVVETYGEYVVGKVRKLKHNINGGGKSVEAY